MNQPNPFEVILREQYKSIKSPREKGAKRGIRNTGLLGSESAELGILKLQSTVTETHRSRQIERTLDPISNMLAHDVAVFPKQNRVVVNEYGVFVPRSLFGYNATIWHEENRESDGSIRVTISSRPSNNQLKSWLAAKPIDCSRELRWLDEHRDEYAGQWVALDGNRLLASGSDACKVRQAAHKLGIALPLIVQVEPSDELPFGGW